MNGNTRVRCIEPFPMNLLRSPALELDALIETPVQDVPFSEFERLQANDILFIDSTHVCTAVSDVTHLILEVLPRLPTGVLIHFHDIFSRGPFLGNGSQRNGFSGMSSTCFSHSCFLRMHSKSGSERNTWDSNTPMNSKLHFRSFPSWEGAACG